MKECAHFHYVRFLAQILLYRLPTFRRNLSKIQFVGSSIVLCQSHWKSLLNFLSVLQRAPLRYTNSFSH